MGTRPPYNRIVQSSSPAVAAVRARDERAVERALAKGASPDEVTDALVVAAILDEETIARRLCRAGPRLDHRARSPIHAAAAHGSEDVVEVLLEARPTLVDHIDADGDTPLSAATHGGYLVVVRQLLERRATVDRGAVHPLLLAARNGDRWIYDELRRESAAPVIRRAEPLLAQGQQRGAQLLAAVRAQRPKKVKAALKGGAWVHTETPDGYPVLTLAARLGNLKIVEALLSGGAQPGRDAESRRLQSHVVHGPLFYWWILEPDSSQEQVAASQEQLDQRIFVHRDGVRDSLYPDQNSRPPYMGNTALEAAAAAGHHEIVHRLLEDSMIPRGLVHDALTGAAASGHRSACRRIIRALGTLGGHSADALHAAAEGGHTEVVTLLLDAGVPVDVLDEDGDCTPLSMAVYGRHLDTARALVERGAGVDKDLEGFRRLETQAQSKPSRRSDDKPRGPRRARRPRLSDLIRAIRQDERERFDELRVHPDIDIDAYDGQGFTPLLVAAQMRSRYMVEALLQMGADPRKASGGQRKGRQWGVTAVMELIDPAPSASVVLPILECLADAGADLKARDNEGRSAMDRARSMGGPVIEAYAAWLSERGVKS